MEDYSDYINAYFHQRLSPEDAKQFERRIIDDYNFAEEVAFYLSVKHTLKEQVIKDKKEWYTHLIAQGRTVSMEPKARVRKLQFYRIAAAAAIIVFIIFSGYLLFFKPRSPQQMAKEYIQQNLQTLSVKMGKKDSLQTGLQLYNEGRLNSAGAQFEQIIQRDTENISAKKYAGIVYLRLGNYDKALAYFQELEKYSLYSNPAIFFQALTLMKRNQPGDNRQAQQLLLKVVDNNLEEKETAAQWLKKW